MDFLCSGKLIDGLCICISTHMCVCVCAYRVCLELFSPSHMIETFKDFTMTQSKAHCLPPEIVSPLVGGAWLHWVSWEDLDRKDKILRCLVHKGPGSDGPDAEVPAQP